MQYDRAYVYNYLITVRLQNAEGVPPENSQRHSLEQEITLALILKSHSKSAAQIFKKLDRRFPHGAGRLDNNWLEDEASAQFGVLGDFPDFNVFIFTSFEMYLTFYNVELLLCSCMDHSQFSVYLRVMLLNMLRHVITESIALHDEICFSLA